MARRPKAKTPAARSAKAKAKSKRTKRPAKTRAATAAPATHIALPGSSRPARNAQRVRDANPAAPVEVTIELRGPALPDVDQIPTRALTHEEFNSKYGASQADADKVSHVLQRFGIKVIETSLPGRSLRASGTVAQMEAAFHPGLGVYENREQGQYRGREGAIMIPKELAGIVTGVFGLDERRVARRKSMSSSLAAAAAHASLGPQTPAELETRYRFPPGTAAGQQIAIAEFEGGYFDSDLTAYCHKQGRPKPRVQVVPVGLNALTLSQIQHLPPQQRSTELDASGEVMMDVQIVAGLCPQAEIFVYFAPFTQKGWVDLLNKVVSGNPAKPVTLSVSWGAPEDSANWSAAARAAINGRLQAAALLGITVAVAAGDDGSGDELTDNKAHVDFPGSSPFVLSVGGTMITGAPPVEQVWWESPGRRTGNGGGATGGGVSVFFRRPHWQNVKVKSLNPGSIDGRVVPDVAALAGQPLHDLVFLGNPQPNGGTSASTPVWAALIARINAGLPAGKRQRFLTPLLYQKGAGGKAPGQTCLDIKQGQNASHPNPGKGYSAGAGFDAVTGWGTPNGTALQGAL
jgi:kumamolisin